MVCDCIRQYICHTSDRPHHHSSLKTADSRAALNSAQLDSAQLNSSVPFKQHHHLCVGCVGEQVKRHRLSGPERVVLGQRCVGLLLLPRPLGAAPGVHCKRRQRVSQREVAAADEQAGRQVAIRGKRRQTRVSRAPCCWGVRQIHPSGCVLQNRARSSQLPVSCRLSNATPHRNKKPPSKVVALAVQKSNHSGQTAVHVCLLYRRTQQKPDSKNPQY